VLGVEVVLTGVGVEVGEVAAICMAAVEIRRAATLKM
jgi:hypothetical protein